MTNVQPLSKPKLWHNMVLVSSAAELHPQDMMWLSEAIGLSISYNLRKLHKISQEMYTHTVWAIPIFRDDSTFTRHSRTISTDPRVQYSWIRILAWRMTMFTRDGRNSSRSGFEEKRFFEILFSLQIYVVKNCKESF